MRIIREGKCGREARVAARCNITGIPTLLYFAGGEVRNTTLGAVSKKKIVDNLEALAVGA